MESKTAHVPLVVISFPLLFGWKEKIDNEYTIKHIILIRLQLKTTIEQFNCCYRARDRDIIKQLNPHFILKYISLATDIVQCSSFQPKCDMVISH